MPSLSCVLRLSPYFSYAAQTQGSPLRRRRSRELVKYTRADILSQVHWTPTSGHAAASAPLTSVMYLYELFALRDATTVTIPSTSTAHRPHRDGRGSPVRRFQLQAYVSASGSNDASASSLLLLLFLLGVTPLRAAETLPVIIKFRSAPDILDSTAAADTAKRQERSRLKSDLTRAARSG